MTVVDFIDVIDDIIDLSSDEETVQPEHISTQPQAMLVDRKAVFVLADEGRQDVQPAFFSAGEGSQEATESENALVATALPSVMERAHLSSDEETVQQEHITTQPQAMLVDRKAVFVLADEGRQDAQAAFVSAGEGSQEATESESALVATALPSVMERAPLDTSEPKNCPSSPTTVPLPSPTSATPKVLVSEFGDTQLVTTALPSVMEKAPLGTAESKNSPISPALAPLLSPTSATPKVLASEVGDAQLVTTALPSVMEEVPLDTAESKNYPVTPASAPLPSPTSTTPKALTSEVGDTKLVRVKYRKKSYHTSTPRRSPRLRECCNNPVEELAGDHKRFRMLDPAEESAAPANN